MYSSKAFCSSTARLLLKYRDYLRGNPHFDRDIYVPRWLCAIGDSPATFFQVGVARRAAALSQMIAKRG
jgi:hypothetical protein